MKTGTLLTLLVAGGVGWFLYRQWKKAKLAVAAVAPVLTEAEAVGIVAAKYQIPEEIALQIVKSLGPKAAVYGPPSPW